MSEGHGYIGGFDPGASERQILRLKAQVESTLACAKKRRKKDPLAPKNPVSAYLFFVAEQRVKLKQEDDLNQNQCSRKSFREIAQELGARWKTMTDEEKQVRSLSLRI